MTPAPQTIRTTLSYLLWLLLSIHPSHAIILYPGDNSVNQTAPDAPRTNSFNAIARVTNSTGGSTAGSAVYVRGKYLLTANHVSNRTHVTFDGVTFWARDTTFSPIQISTADMKLIKLIEDPGLPETPLFTAIAGDTLVTATLIGWGVGRDPNIADAGTGPTNIWKWGSTSTLAKRWGNNRIDALFTPVQSGLSYTVLEIDLDSNQGSDEAAAAVFDSGSGLFISDAGTWKLAGLTTLVTTTPGHENASVFDQPNGGNKNYFVRITDYASAVEAAIPDLTDYSDWKVDHGLYGNDALNTADTDGDGVGQLHEFAFGGDPNKYESDLLPTNQITQDAGSNYLEIRYTRPTFNNALTYTVKTTSDLTNWPTDSSGVDTPVVIDNGNGTETWTYRRTLEVAAAEMAFMRVEVSE